MEFVLIRGGSPVAVDIAAYAGWYYGVRSDYTEYGICRMLDFDWQSTSKSAWSRYMQLVRQHRPKRGVVIDLVRPEQVSLMMSRIEDVAAYNMQPVVVPKYPGAVRDIPTCVYRPDGTLPVVVGVSVPTAYAGSLPRAHEVAKRQVHLLGGHPDQWRWLRHYYSDSEIVSADGNAMVQKAARGQFWRRGGAWGYRDVRGLGYSTRALAIASLRNAAYYYHHGRVNHTAYRVLKCRQELGFVPVQLELFA